MKIKILTSITLVALIIACGENTHKKPVYEITRGDAPKSFDNIPVFTPESVPAKDLRFAGTYQGSFPCADCEKTDVTVKLYDDNTFERDIRKIGGKTKGFSHAGKFMWSTDGKKIILEGKSKSKYEIAQGKIYQLGIDGTQCMTFQGVEFVLTKK